MRRPFLFIALFLCLISGLPAQTGQRPPTVSDDLRGASLRGNRIRVIVQGPDGSDLSSVRGQLRGIVRRELKGGAALEVSGEELDALSRDSSFAHISLDSPVGVDMAITNKVTGANSVWQGSTGLLGLLATAGYTGNGITVAVLDSGIAPHAALDHRVIARVNLVSWESPSTGDPYGHGTHIAGAIGGNTYAAQYVTPAFAGGSAPGVRLVDVRVLGSNGGGYTSDVIAGIDWAIANRATYGIRVLNLSLGHPVYEPAALDPLCQAVARAYSAGLVVVASAGNYGVTSKGEPVLGGISSPGNSPFAVTVGAVDTLRTVDRSDDRVAPYSSKGPSRYDLAVKPDVVAPGTRVVSLESWGSYLASTYPAWHIAGSGRNAYFRLSGTSMSTAVVSGGVALLLNANPNMTPAQVKIVLQSGATFMPRDGLMAAGAGSVSLPTSMKVADNRLLTAVQSTVASLLGASSGVSFFDSGTLSDRVYDRTGVRLLGLLDLGGLLGDPTGGEWGVLNLIGLNNPLANVPANRLVWGDVAGWTSNYHVVWGDTLTSPSGQHVVWGDSENVTGNHVVWGDSIPANGGR